MTPASAALPDEAGLRSWIVEMKASPKGPFERIRWFCADGTVHPPKPYPCEKRGGGIQHGEWNARTVALRDGGYRVGNVLADLSGDTFRGGSPDLDGLRQILLERFMMGVDQGWIFHGALRYRGALQIEDEEAGATRIVDAILADPEWLDPARYFLARETLRLLPRTTDATSAAAVRQLAIDVAVKDPGFNALRAKIHNAPDAEDAARVRAYDAEKGRDAARPLYEELAAAIDQLYAGRGAADALAAIGEASPDQRVGAMLVRHAEKLRAAESTGDRFVLAARYLAYYRDLFDKESTTPAGRGSLLEASLVLEDEAYAAGNSLLPELAKATRLERLFWVERAIEALYGTGLVSERGVQGVRSSVARIEAAAPLTVDVWREEVRYLARVPEWAGRWIEFNFAPQVARFAVLDPEARLYPQFRVRGSPLLFYSAIVDDLGSDANRVGGIEHQLFGVTRGAGLRALNPGLARGALLSPDGELHGLRRDGIYLLPETVAELPPVAGILTLGEGSSLSHVQLLARNLGIPNVVVGELALPAVKQRVGRPAVLAVSPGGVVQLEEDGPSWDAVFGPRDGGGAGAGDVVIRPDLVKLDLSEVHVVPLTALRAADSGRLSGPKGANLGELKHHFGAAVPPGFVIPFGVFRKQLDRPLEPGGPTVWDWMRARYAAIAALDGQPEAQEKAVRAFLTRLRGWIETTGFPPDFDAELSRALDETFGADGSYGVFVRSDTNVEDLAGFTGAGLNLTLPNVVGKDEIKRAVREVWASPFTERAYSWRQNNMEGPEYVFPAVVVQLAFPAEKSGVMVTADVDTGDPNWLSIAVSEGVGGAVEGQATESLLVRADGSETRFLAQATAPDKAIVTLAGGVDHVPASGTQQVLQPAEIQQLVAFAKTAPDQFPSLREEAGPPKPADVEFAFKDGKLALLQLRPFVESKSAQRNEYLLSLDARLGDRGGDWVDLNGIPKEVE